MSGSAKQSLIDRLARVTDQIARLAPRVAAGDDGAIQLTRALTERNVEITSILLIPYVDPEVNNAQQMPSASDVIRANFPNSTGGDTPV